jgi:hypothetical protein
VKVPSGTDDDVDPENVAVGVRQTEDEPGRRTIRASHIEDLHPKILAAWLQRQDSNLQPRV